MTDHDYFPRKPGSTQRRTASANGQPIVASFWFTMIQLFGHRWTDTYGEAPPPLWQTAISSLDDSQIRTLVERLMRSGSAHPPTLPEVMALATKPQTMNSNSSPPPQVSPGERAACNFFLHYAVRGRWFGIAVSQVADLRVALIAIAESFTGSNAELVAALEAESERQYPKRYAAAWAANPPGLRVSVRRLEDVLNNLDPDRIGAAA